MHECNVNVKNVSFGKLWLQSTYVSPVQVSVHLLFLFTEPVDLVKVQQRAPVPVAALTERWMILAAPRSREKHPDSPFSSRTHQWQMASCWADGAFDCYSLQLRHQGQPGSSSVFSLASLKDSGGMPVLWGMQFPPCYSLLINCTVIVP